MKPNKVRFQSLDVDKLVVAEPNVTNCAEYSTSHNSRRVYRDFSDNIPLFLNVKDACGQKYDQTSPIGSKSLKQKLKY